MATATVPEIQRSNKTRLLLLLAALPLAYGLCVSLLHLKASWDDAAITAAFARTWAQTGHIALTPLSQTVEGFSSVLWFWLLSIPYFFTRHPNAGLVWMKVLSAGFFALSIWLTYFIAARELQSQSRGVAAALLFAFCTTPLREMQNGMEMNLATFLVLLLFRALAVEKPRVLYCWILTSLILLARFESPFLLLLMLCGFLYARRNTRALTKIALLTGCTLLAIELSRHHLFGEWMPNTVYAKLWPPYRDWSTPAKFSWARAWAVLEVLIVLPVPILISIFYRSRAKIHQTIWVLASGCFIFGLMFGSNWGPYGRMVEPMLPFLIMAIVAVCPLRSGLAILVCAQALTWCVQQAALPYGNVSIAQVERLGIAADSMRLSLHRDTLTVMISDIGGSALCCERLRIADSALLANRELARKGWAGFSSYFREVNPDVVEAHRPWSTEAHIYTDGLLANYTPEEVDGIRLYVRNDLIAH
jgi:hypothetical protein